MTLNDAIEQGIISKLERALENADHLRADPHWPEIFVLMDVAYQANLKSLEQRGYHLSAYFYRREWETMKKMG
jgi:hypothetical protein